MSALKKVNTSSSFSLIVFSVFLHSMSCYSKCRDVLKQCEDFFKYITVVMENLLYVLIAQRNVLHLFPITDD